jgi:hypothetical protein
MPAVLLRVCCPCRAPGQSETPPGLRRLLLLGLLGLFRLFRLLRFLSHSILSGFNGLKRDTRHARRRASLAKSSTLIPADSQAPAPCCHAPVTALSTDVTHFDALFAKIVATRRAVTSRCGGARSVFRCRAVTTSDPSHGRLAAKMWRISGIGAIRLRDLHQFKTTALIPRRC